ncbi:MAG: glutamate N-acetyltransferase/amino-acid acetyltransferase, partial [Actinomycetota bacterium]
MIQLPRGFSSFVTNVGIKDSTPDFTLIAANSSIAAAGVFTKSRFAGPSVEVSRRHIADNRARALVVISKNANVANGPSGLANAEEIVTAVAKHLGCLAGDVLIASTGVIGRPYPMDNIRNGIAALPFPLPDQEAEAVARGIMTTDTVPKIAESKVDWSSARVVGVAKGVGMIEPDMATLITVVLTDANIEPELLDVIWRRVIDRTFNCVTI